MFFTIKSIEINKSLMSCVDKYYSLLFEIINILEKDTMLDVFQYLIAVLCLKIICFMITIYNDTVELEGNFYDKFIFMLKKKLKQSETKNKGYKELHPYK